MHEPKQTQSWKAHRSRSCLFWRIKFSYCSIDDWRSPCMAWISVRDPIVCVNGRKDSFDGNLWHSKCLRWRWRQLALSFSLSTCSEMVASEAMKLFTESLNSSFSTREKIQFRTTTLNHRTHSTWTWCSSPANFEPCPPDQDRDNKAVHSVDQWTVHFETKC